MLHRLKDFFRDRARSRDLLEGVFAHNYRDPAVREEIQQQYRSRYKTVITPLTDPEKFDPLAPPKGWAYDPYYECWVEIS